jgi:Spy/CpxP family protein refolding chaperone
MKPSARFAVVPMFAVLALSLAAAAQDLPLQRFTSNDGIHGTFWTNDNGEHWKEMALPGQGRVDLFP